VVKSRSFSDFINACYVKGSGSKLREAQEGLRGEREAREGSKMLREA